MEAAFKAAEGRGLNPHAPSPNLDDYMVLEEAFLGKGGGGTDAAPERDKGLHSTPEGRQLQEAEEELAIKQIALDEAAEQAGDPNSRTVRQARIDLEEARFRHSQAKWAPQAHLDEIAKRYEDIAFYGDLACYKVASRLLKKFLKGDGGTEVIDSKWLRSYDVVNKVVEKNQRKLKNQFTDFEKVFGKQAKDLMQGKPVKLIAKESASVSAPRRSDLYFASNKSDIVTSISAEATRDGNKILITGMAKNKWKDKYNWHKGKSFHIPFFGEVKSSDALELQKNRSAKPFEMESTWQQEFHATGRIEDGKIVIENLTWRDVN